MFLKDISYTHQGCIYLTKRDILLLSMLKKNILFKIETFCNIISAFTVTFDQFNASLLNKSISFLKKKH